MKFHDGHTPSEAGRGFCYLSAGRGFPQPDHLQRKSILTALFRLGDGQLFDDESRSGDAVERAHKIYAKLLLPSQGLPFFNTNTAYSLSWMLVPAKAVI